MEEIHERWLLIGFTDSSSRMTFVQLIDPESGKLLDTFEMEQEEADKEAREKRYAEATAQRDFSGPEILAWAMWALSDDSPKRGTGANYLFTCPECRNKKSHKKKFAVDPYLGYYGAYMCYECRAGGSLNKLIAGRCGFLESLTVLSSIKCDHPKLMEKANALCNGRNVSGGYVGDGYRCRAA